MVDKFPNCDKPEHLSTREELVESEREPKIRTGVNFAILSKNRYYANIIGYQCYKTKTTTYLNQTWYFKTTRQQIKETIKLTRLECLIMMDSKTCENQPMSCDANGCHLTARTIDQYFWNYDSTIVTFDCLFHKKQIIAENPWQKLFHNPGNDCTFNNLYCSLYDSIIAWENVTQSSCPYTIIHYGRHYKEIMHYQHDHPAILTSNTDKMTFQVTRTFHECGLQIMATTTELYLNELERDTEAVIPKSNSDISFNRQHDINNFLLAENDYHKYRQWRSKQKTIDLETFHRCQAIATQMQAAISRNNEFSQLYDINGREQLVYSSNNNLFLPYCKPVDSVQIRETSSCFIDLPITFALNNTIKEGFITKTNVIVQKSPEISCDLIDFSFTTKYDQVIVRSRNKANVFSMDHAIKIDITASNHKHEDLNLMHHSEIIENYKDTQKIDYETNDDIIGNFYTAPNDKGYSELEWASKNQNKVNNLSNTIIGLISTYTIIQTITSVAITIIFIIIIWKIVKLLIVSCSRGKVQTQIITVPIRNNEQDHKQN
jgi:hypothetical protein